MPDWLKPFKNFGGLFGGTKPLPTSVIKNAGDVLAGTKKPTQPKPAADPYAFVTGEYEVKLTFKPSPTRFNEVFKATQEYVSKVIVQGGEQLRIPLQQIYPAFLSSASLEQQPNNPGGILWGNQLMIDDPISGHRPVTSMWTGVCPAGSFNLHFSMMDDVQVEGNISGKLVS